MNKYQDIIGRINYMLFLVVVALLPFPQTPLRYACVFWIISWFMELRWLKRPPSLKANPLLIPFILFGLWYALKALSGLWATDLHAWAWQMERYLTFILMVPVGIWGLNEYYDWKKAGQVLVIAAAVAVPFYIALMTSFHFHRDWIALFTWREEWFVVPDWYTFCTENISIFKHRLFLCSIELFAIIVAFQLPRKSYNYVAIAFMLAAIPLTGSRQSVITAVAIAALALVGQLPKPLRLRYGLAILLLGIVLGALLLSLHPRMHNFNPDNDIRLTIWSVALQHPSDYLAHGIGAGQSTNYLVEHFREAELNYYVYMRYHSHDQYLEELMEIGIGGLLLFIIAWLAVPLCTKTKGRPLAILFTTIFVLNMFTDCMFGQFCGIALWAISMLFILLQARDASLGVSTPLPSVVRPKP